MGGGGKNVVKSPPPTESVMEADFNKFIGAPVPKYCFGINPASTGVKNKGNRDGHIDFLDHT